MTLYYITMASIFLIGIGIGAEIQKRINIEKVWIIELKIVVKGVEYIHEKMSKNYPSTGYINYLKRGIALYYNNFTAIPYKYKQEDVETISIKQKNWRM